MAGSAVFRSSPLQIRTRVLDDVLANDFHRWYPGFTHQAEELQELAA